MAESSNPTVNSTQESSDLSHRLSRAILLFGLFLALAGGVCAQDFSEGRLKEGKASFAKGRFADAIGQLRIAAFGFLDRPELLSESLVYLSLAQDSAGQRAEAYATLRRFADVERRFGVYTRSPLPPGVRAEFESRFRQRLPAAIVASAAPPSAPVTPAPAPSTREAPASSPTREAPARAPLPTREAQSERPVSTPPISGDGETQSPPPETETAPQVKKAVRPVYPRSALQAGVGGTVLLKVLVSERGEPLQVEIIHGVRADLSDAAVAALKQWTFEPARKNGKGMRAWTTVAIPFTR